MQQTEIKEMTQLRISNSLLKSKAADIILPLTSTLAQPTTTSPPAQTQSFTVSLYNSASKLVKTLQPYEFVPNLLVHSTYSVIQSLIKQEAPASWDIRTSISVALMKSGMTYKNNSSERIKTLQALAITPIPTHITITNSEFTYSPDMIFKMEQCSKQARSRTLPEVPKERSHSTSTVKLEFITVTENLDKPDRQFIMYLHGGAYFCGSLQTHRSLAYRIAEESGATVVMVAYRLSPEFAFPAALHDAFAAYLHLQNPAHALFSSHLPNITPSTSNVSGEIKEWIFMGDSAGGGLALSLMVYIKDYINTGTQRIVPMPASAVLFSPWVDLTCSSASWLSPVNQDYLPTCPPLGYFYNLFDSEKGNPVMWYTAGNQENLVRAVHGSDVDSGVGLIDDKIDEEDAIKLVTHPLVSPYYANLTNLPPLLIQAGGVEVIRDETIEIINMLHKSSPHPSWYRHELYKDMPHVFQTFFWTESSKLAIGRAGKWCKAIWDGVEPRTIEFDEHRLVECVEGLDECLEDCVGIEIYDVKEEATDEAMHGFEQHPFY